MHVLLCRTVAQTISMVDHFKPIWAQTVTLCGVSMPKARQSMYSDDVTPRRTLFVPTRVGNGQLYIWSLRWNLS